MTSFEPDKKKRGRREPFYEVLAHRLAELEVSPEQEAWKPYLPCPAAPLTQPTSFTRGVGTQLDGKKACTGAVETNDCTGEV